MYKNEQTTERAAFEGLARYPKVIFCQGPAILYCFSEMPKDRGKL
jgi:hypothetical protein